MFSFLAKLVLVNRLLRLTSPKPSTVVLTAKGLDKILGEMNWSVTYKPGKPCGLTWSRIAIVRNRWGREVARANGAGSMERIAERNALRAAIEPLIKWTE